MSNKKYALFMILLLPALLLSACGGAAEQEGPVALQVTGKVVEEKSWTEGQVEAMDTMKAQRENKSGELSTYTGVSVMSVLEEAGLEDDASSVVFVAGDGYEASVSVDELQACPDCILSFRNQGGFSAVMPGFSGKLQVKGVVELRVE